MTNNSIWTNLCLLGWDSLLNIFKDRPFTLGLGILKKLLGDLTPKSCTQVLAKDLCFIRQVLIMFPIIVGPNMSLNVVPNKWTICSRNISPLTETIQSLMIHASTSGWTD